MAEAVALCCLPYTGAIHRTCGFKGFASEAAGRAKQTVGPFLLGFRELPRSRLRCSASVQADHLIVCRKCRIPVAWVQQRGTAVSPNELELIHKLRRLDEECEQLNRRITLAAQRKRFGVTPEGDTGDESEEQRCLREMSRLMDRIRAVESGLGRARCGLMPAVH
jgi:hypothetical protein